MKFWINDSKKTIVDLKFDELNEIYVKDIKLYMIIVSKIFNEIEKMENVTNSSEMDEQFECYEGDVDRIISIIESLVIPLAINTIDKKIKYLNLLDFLHKNNSDIPIPVDELNKKVDFMKDDFDNGDNKDYIEDLLKIKENLTS